MDCLDTVMGAVVQSTRFTALPQSFTTGFFYWILESRFGFFFEP